jgi:hypothetical protein
MRSSVRIGVRPDARVQLQRRLVRRSVPRSGQPCSALLTHLTDAALKELQPLSASSILSLSGEAIAVKRP